MEIEGKTPVSFTTVNVSFPCFVWEVTDRDVGSHGPGAVFQLCFSYCARVVWCEVLGFRVKSCGNVGMTWDVWSLWFMQDGVTPQFLLDDFQVARGVPALLVICSFQT